MTRRVPRDKVRDRAEKQAMKTNLSSKEKKTIAAILIASFLIKLVLAFTLTADIRSDSLDYQSLAKNIITTGEYSLDGKPTASSTIGYPLFLSGIYSLTGADQLWARLAQSVIEVFTCLLFLFFCMNYLDTRKSIIALSVYAFFPSNILYTQTILSETLFALLALIIIVYFLNEKIDSKIFLIGMVAGYAVLVRSSFVFALAVIPLFLLFNGRKLFEGYKHKRIKRGIQYSILFFIGAVIVVAPWLIRNKIVLNTFAIGTHGGSTFWSGSNPDATGTWYHKIEDTNPIFNIADEAERDKKFYQEGLKYAVNNPHKFAILGFKKLGYLFSSERMILLYFAKNENRARTSSEVYASINPFLIALINIPYFIVMLLGTWGLLMIKRKRFIVYGMILAWLFIFFIFVALARYHYVLIPFFIMGTVKFIYEYRQGFKGALRSMPVTYKISAAVFNLFLLAVWTSEFYLMYK
jgi:4-amino-4-deoxy-L-arabinose transferase-like glycosyltransferase